MTRLRSHELRRGAARQSEDGSFDLETLER